LYNPVERPDAAFSASYHGGEKNSWDAINQDSVPDGNYDAWNRLLALLNQGVSTTEAYQRIQGSRPDGTRDPQYENLLDVGNMIDYMILNFYIGNTDWPQRNWWVGRNRDGDQGFQFYPWDTETALGVTGLDVNRLGVAEAVARPYAAARANADFRMEFADRVYRHFYNGGALYVNPASVSWDVSHPENNRPAARFAALAEQVSRAVVGESARWGDQLGQGPFTRDEHWQHERDNLLVNYFPRRSAMVLDHMRRAGLYPRIDPPVMNQRGGQVGPGFKLALSAPQGTIFYTTAGTDPRAPVTIQELSRKTLVSTNAAKKVFVPSVANRGSELGTNWQGGQEPFADSIWVSGTGGVGYDQAADYKSYFQVDVQAEMAANNSVFIRIPFDYDGTDLERLNFMTLRVQYDDGFAAFLNGQLIAAANAPADLQWNSGATGQNSDAAAVQFEEFKVDNGLSALKAGRNILAVQGLNVSLTSSDFLIGVEMTAGERMISGGPVNALPYREPIAVRELTTIKTRVFDGVEWSALNEATLQVGTPDLRISELHYHPAQPTAAERAAGFTDADEFEFIELCNCGTGTCDLTGYRFVTGVEFDFTGAVITQLPAGQCLVLVKNRAAFLNRYGPSCSVAGEYSGRLDNGGELIELVNPRGEPVLSFRYGSEAPWPMAADGSGPSLEVVDAKGDLSTAATWRESAVVGGSPGRSELVPGLKVQMMVSAAGQAQLRFPGKAGIGYTVYFRGSLSTGDWQILHQGASLPQEQMAEVTLDLSPDQRTGFYRVSIP
jgi:hypothetical protein